MFAKRVVSGLLLVAAAIVLISLGGYVTAATGLFVSLIAYRELMKACSLSGHLKSEGITEKHKYTIGCFSLPEIIGYAGIIAYYALLTFASDKKWVFISLFIILTAFLTAYVFTFPEYSAQEIMMSYFNLAYAPLMISFIYIVRELPGGIFLVWLIFSASVCDTFAYFVGSLFGNHKLAPVLSPKKSIEGAIGGVLGTTVCGALYGYFVQKVYPEDMNVIIAFAIIAFLGSIVSQIGDLAASAIKRNMNIKDYGKIIPGHGGIMDRLDSILFTAPMVYFIYLFFAGL